MRLASVNYDLSIQLKAAVFPIAQAVGTCAPSPTPSPIGVSSIDNFKLTSENFGNHTTI